jgi:hypothetical protein
MKTRAGLLILMLAMAGAAWAQTPCESLANLSLPNVKVTLAQSVAAGAWMPPARAGGPPPVAAPDGGRALERPPQAGAVEAQPRPHPRCRPFAAWA